jgi:hypothetical protein
VSEASRQWDLPPSEIEIWVDEGKRGLENALRAYTGIAGLAALPQRLRRRRQSGVGAGADRALRQVGSCAEVLPAAFGQRPSVHQSGLYASGAQLRPATVVHHSAPSAAKRHGRACDQDFQGTVRASAPHRKPATRKSGRRRLDPVLQPPASPIGAGHEDTR